MRKFYNRVFSDPLLLEEMLNLYAAGWSSVALGIHYECDHTSVLYQIRKHGVLMQRVRVPMPRRKKQKKKPTYFPLKNLIPPKRGKYDYLFDEPVNPGKNYKDYVEDRKRREAQRHETAH